MSRIGLTALVLAAALAAVALGGSASAGVSGSSSRNAAAAKLKLPVWVVDGPAISDSTAQGLADSLGLADNGFNPDTNTMSFFDPLFMAMPSDFTGEEGSDESGMPTQTDAADLQAASAMTAIPFDDAIQMFQGALADNQLDPLDGTARVTRVAKADNSFFDVFLTKPGEGESPTLHVPIATNVHYDILLGSQQIPLRGPGAKVSATFNGDGVATQVQYALRMIHQGENVVLITPAQAMRNAINQYKSQCGLSQLQNVHLTSQSIYFAPPMDVDAKKIYPAYQFDGTGFVGGEEVQLKQTIVTAVQNAPHASIIGRSSGRSISARALVSGGTKPYEYDWTSCTTTLDPAKSMEPSISYEVNPRSPTTLETLTLQVTDANGLTTFAKKSFLVPAVSRLTRAQSSVRATQAIGPVDVGAETVGTAMGLPGCIPDTTGFVGRMALGGFSTEFQWYNQNAWEQDFKDPTRPGGDDTNYADHVDETFYCGHANGNGWSFPGSHTDGFLNYPDAFLGNNDLEWLGIAACGPLQNGSPDWWQRWGPAFGGLHLLLGYMTTSYDATGEGFDWANGQLGPFWWGSPMTVLQSWIQMAINNQPSSVRWAIMGVIGSGGVWNYNDYFWGQGPTGPDILPGSIVGYFRVSGPS